MSFLDRIVDHVQTAAVKIEQIHAPFRFKVLSEEDIA